MSMLFWEISQEGRIKLMQYQAENHKDKLALDMASRKAPWELELPRPEIPAKTDMTEEEVDHFMRQRPHPGKDGRRG